MKELFREPDIGKLYSIKALLESNMISCFVKGESYYENVAPGSGVGLSEMPTLCIHHEKDFEKALSVVKSALKEIESKKSDEDITCPNCRETNPSHFELCWSCEAELS